MFTFTYSKLKNALGPEGCPKRYYEVDVNKKYKDHSDALDYGIKVHNVMEKALKKTARIPDTMKELQYWVDWALALPGKHEIEAKLCINRDFGPTEYFGPRVWFRGKGDFVSVDRENKLAILVDWKTGKRLDEPLQLWLLAQCIFASHHDVETVVAYFVWLKEWDGSNAPDCVTAHVLKRDRLAEMWANMLPQIEQLEKMHKTDDFPARPNHNCRWCPVTSCPHNGR